MLKVTRPNTVDVARLIALQWNQNGHTCRLFKNDWLPSPDDDAGDYVQCDFSGYLPVGIIDWGNVRLNADLKGEISAAAKTFQCTALDVVNQVFGYYITDVQGALVLAERNIAAPVGMGVVGALYVVYPVLTVVNESEVVPDEGRAGGAGRGRAAQERPRRRLA